MMDYIKLDDAREAVWRILNGMGISQKYNDRMVEEVDAVLCEYAVESFEPVIRCRDCRYWQTGIAYSAVGRCKHPKHKQITNRNYYCADGRDKE